MRVGSKEYFSILFDNNEFTELDGDLVSGDPLHFEDTKKYTERLVETIKKNRVERCHPLRTWKNERPGIGNCLYGL